MNLTSFDEEVVMKLITALSRISFLPMEDMSRQGVSGWIRSMLFREHRARGFLIPRSDEITAKKGSTSTTAVIKGKSTRVEWSSTQFQGYTSMLPCSTSLRYIHL